MAVAPIGTANNPKNTDPVPPPDTGTIGADGASQQAAIDAVTDEALEIVQTQITAPSDGFTKSSGSKKPDFSDPPPNLHGPELDRYNNALKVIDKLGPGAAAALADVVGQFKDGGITDPKTMAAAIEHAFKEHGVALTPPGYHQGETPQKQTAGFGVFSQHQDASDPTALDPADAPPPATTWSVLGNMQGGDIEALSFLVLMESSKSAQEDLKAIMAGVKAINNTKARQRELLGNAQKLSSSLAPKASTDILHAPADIPTRTFGKAVVSADPSNPKGYTDVDNGYFVGDPTKDNFTKADVDAVVDKIKSDLDSMSEMGEMESLRLQMAMDRMSKMMSTLSNLLKKISDTSSQIVQNVK